MYYGIDVDFKEFTVCQIDENKNVKILSHFFKEGLYWFIDHHHPDILTVNIAINQEPSKTKYALDIIHKIQKEFEYIIADENIIKKGERKIIIKTATDLFFKKIIRKDILPITTREGLEQRLYNLKKTGIKLPKGFLSKDKNKLRRELNAVISAFTSLSLNKKDYEVVESFEEKLFIPKYRFVPSTNRIKRKVKEKNGKRQSAPTDS
ncbi:hypothetical protein [Hydrogenothermus marinus]|uniref:Uncharacterized protein n=1 Tax=Hydrogenothermus marinus TaxID=133270 RepID=A0A3M0BMN1_9AQUI|nr:hypothetical protein [Hydrogenothermus marinus]RMA97734.1 hypothetical protein CLV39_0358 [Hydrogenothermus marinus]